MGEHENERTIREDMGSDAQREARGAHVALAQGEALVKYIIETDSFRIKLFGRERERGRGRRDCQ